MPARLEFIPARGGSMSNSRNSTRTSSGEIHYPRRPLLWLPRAAVHTSGLLDALARLGAVSFSFRARPEILDGAKRLPASLD